MSEALEALRTYLARMRNGPIKDSGKVVALLSACWNELIGDEYKQGISADKILTSADKMEWNRPELRFQVKRRVSNSAHLEPWSVDTDSGVARDLAFDEILRSPSATKLNEAGVSPGMVKHFLRRVAEAGSERIDVAELKRRRNNAKRLGTCCLELAQEIRARKQPLAEVLWPDRLPDWRKLPEMLAYFARMYVLSSRPPASYWLPAIPAFVVAVKAITGREHYPEIADLLDAINVKFGRDRGTKKTSRKLARQTHRDGKIGKKLTQQQIDRKRKTGRMLAQQMHRHRQKEKEFWRRFKKGGIVPEPASDWLPRKFRRI